MPPDHAGVGYDDGDAGARTGFSCWAVFYAGEENESREHFLTVRELISYESLLASINAVGGSSPEMPQGII